MDPTQNDNQAQGAGAMPPAQGMPPAGADQGASSSSWPPAPAAGADPAAMGDAAMPKPDEVGMGDETPAATEPAAPAAPAMPSMPSEPAAPTADGGAAAPQDPSAGMPGAAPQQ